MGLPNLKTIRINEIKLGNTKIKISPWTNRQMIQYEHVRDEVFENSTLSKEERRERLYELIYDYLIFPNVDLKRSLTIIDREILLVEMYKISRGNVIPLSYKCSSCGTTNEFYFDLTKHFKVVDLKSKEFEINHIKFKLSSSNLSVDELKDMSDANLKYIISHVKEIEIKGQKYTDYTIDELYDWFLDDLDENTFSDFLDKIIEMIPHIEMNVDVECVKCNHQQSFVFTELPDFSLMRSSKGEE